MAGTKEVKSEKSEWELQSADECDTYLSVNYKKSNMLIGAKYKSTLFENKLMAISLANIPYNAVESQNGTLITKMKAADIRKMLNANKGSFYSQLNNAAQSMTAKSVGYSDPEQQRFEYIAVVIRAVYEKGYFTIEYNPYIKNYLTDIKSNFTKLNLPIMLSFESVYTFRLYELLKSKAYIPKNMQETFANKNVRKFNIRISLSELKLTMGVVNAELDKVKRILNKSEYPDFDKAVQASPEQMYTGFGDFKRRILDIAVEEINKVSDMHVVYETVRVGSGKVTEIIFKVELKQRRITLSSEEKDEIIDRISELIETPLKVKDLRSIAEAAEYDYDLVEKAYDGAINSTNRIENLTGFLISAIKNRYFDVTVEETVKDKKTGKRASKPINPFIDFEQNDYDFDQLEMDLIPNSYQEN